MGPLGVQEMLAIFLVALLLFGPKKLPELGRMLGKAVREFRRAKNELRSTFESHLSELEREVDLDRQLTSGSQHPSVSYPHPYDELGSQGSSYNSGSEPYPPYGSYRNGSSDAYVSQGTERPEITASDDVSAVEHEPIAGTVPRSTGVQPSLSGDAEEERTA